MNSILPLFKWLEDTRINDMINNSNWLFPAIEGVHIVALCLLFGAIIILNLRLMGVMMKGRSLPELAREFEPFTLCSLIIILLTGVLLFVAEAVKSFYSGPFRIKIVLLATALVFHYAVSWRLMRKEDAQRSGVFSKVAAGFAIALWVSVGFAGRAIGFF
jgi:hypothetical protein